MRQIGTIPSEQRAERFRDYLETLGIGSQLEQDANGWAVWIFDEDQLEPARLQLTEFNANPESPTYVEAGVEAERIRREAEKKRERARKNQVDLRRRWERPFAARCPLTVLMIAISVIVALASSFGATHEPLIRMLSIAGYVHDGNWIRWQGLSELRAGEVWRCFTPMFIHFGPVHLAGNMFGLWYLGAAIEFRRNTLRFLVMVLFIAGTSNLAQYWWSGSPSFGGMSGVVFGLFGYLWMKSRYDPEAGFFMPQRLVTWMLFWLVLCYTGLIGPIANAAHTVGLLAGGMLALISTAVRGLMRR